MSEVEGTSFQGCFAHAGSDRLENTNLPLQTRHVNHFAVFCPVFTTASTFSINRIQLIYVFYWRACTTTVRTVANNSCSSGILAPALFRVFSECDWDFLHMFYLGLESHYVSSKETNKELKSFKEEQNWQFSDFSCFKIQCVPSQVSVSIIITQRTEADEDCDLYAYH